jgi:molybdopterin synthase sulfur carrier subunit
VRLQVLLFAAVAEQAGRSSLELELNDGACVADARAALRVAIPAAAAALNSARLAVDEAFADDDEVLLDGVILAVIPPVAGG